MQNNKKGTYLFFYLKTGGGHLATTNALAQQFKKNYPEISIELEDGLSQVNKYFIKFIESGYVLLQSKGIYVYNALYALNMLPLITRLSAGIFNSFVKKELEKRILNKQPEKIIILHFFLIKPIYEIVEKHQLSCKVLTVITDPYSPPLFWYLHKNQNFIVFSERAKKQIQGFNKHINSIEVFPFIVDDRFTTKPTDQEIMDSKKLLSLDPTKKVVLILGGGDGLYKGDEIAKNILKTEKDSYVILICGKNKYLYKKAQNLKQQNNYEFFIIYKYVDLIRELLLASDLVITKCGPSTIMEILLAGKIPIISYYLWGQEKGNMEFVKQNKIGLYQKNRKKLVKSVKDLLDNQDNQELYVQNIQKIGIKNGTEDVTHYIYSFN